MRYVTKLFCLLVSIYYEQTKYVPYSTYILINDMVSIFIIFLVKKEDK